ncbi:hypothetical protein HOY82DRAFT_560927, partial [Tuber indicum]
NNLVLTDQQYLIYWPLVDGFWTHTSCEKHKHKRSITRYYSCRISKTRESSKADPFPEENLSGKARNTAYYEPGKCPMKIKVTESIVPEVAKTFQVEQIKGKEKNSREHNHSMEESWIRKRSSFLTEIIRNELVRGYTPAQVRDRLKGTGRAGGSKRLESIGGVFIDRLAKPLLILKFFLFS